MSRRFGAAGIRRKVRGGGVASQSAASPSTVAESISDLAALWFAETDYVTIDTGVSLWVPRAEDSAIDYDLTQATGSAQPPYDATSSGNLNSKPSVAPSTGDSMTGSNDLRDIWHLGATDWSFFFCGRFPASATKRLLLTNAFAAATADGFELVRSSGGEIIARVANHSGTYYAQVSTSSSGAFISTDAWFCVRLRVGTDIRIDRAGGATVTAAIVGTPSPDPGLTHTWFTPDYFVPYMALYRRAISDAEIALLAADVATSGANDYGVTA